MARLEQVDVDVAGEIVSGGDIMALLEEIDDDWQETHQLDSAVVSCYMRVKILFTGNEVEEGHSVHLPYTDDDFVKLNALAELITSHSQNPMDFNNQQNLLSLKLKGIRGEIEEQQQLFLKISDENDTEMKDLEDVQLLEVVDLGETLRGQEEREIEALEHEDTDTTQSGEREVSGVYKEVDQYEEMCQQLVTDMEEEEVKMQCEFKKQVEQIGGHEFTTTGTNERRTSLICMYQQKIQSAKMEYEKQVHRLRGEIDAYKMKRGLL